VFDILTKKFSSLFSTLTASQTLTESAVTDTMAQIKDALLEADVPYAVVEAFLAELTKKIVGQKLHKSLKPSEQFMSQVYEVMCQFMGSPSDRPYAFQLPATVMVMGLQGSGKTTTIAKLAHHTIKEAQKRGKRSSILVASIDFYRPAAIDQLEILAAQVSAPFYRAVSTTPLGAVQEIMAHAKKVGSRLVFLDTAGRLHVDTSMLQELHDIDVAIHPRHKLLVLDAMTGQESLAVARAFDTAVGFEAAILTKMDSDTRGGAAFAFRYTLKKPIVFLGSGEKPDDLTLFNPVRAVGKMLGRGDLITLAEKADEKIKQSEQDMVLKAFTSGHFTLADFANQMNMVGKLGPLSSVMAYLPGMGGQVSKEQIEHGEREIGRFKAIISSMTPQERTMPDVINESRGKRIAKGAGVAPGDVTILLERFKQVQQYVKLFKKSGFLKSMFR
jgi:signal recognition particle subunit SRP54